MKTALALVLIVSLAVGGAAYYTTYSAGDTTGNFREAAIKRGDLRWSISATGTVEPEEVVDVGAQVVGRIKSFGLDPSDPAGKKTIDYCSVVHKDTILALIDDSVYKAQVAQAEASLVRSQADLIQLKAHAYQAEQEWKRAESLRPHKAIADTDYDLTLANYKAAVANVGVGEAVIKQSKAALDLAQSNLNYTVIKSPVEGTVIDRRVNVGQTLVGSMTAASCFLLAKDLRRIQVWASVNEADIGRIHIDMPVQFTVDAYSGETFHGKVSQIRLNAIITQNVVTYTVVVSTDNFDGRLLPYLTANLQFEIEHRDNVLLVPNSALRWKPRPPQMDPEIRDSLQAVTSGTSPAAKSPGESQAAQSAKEREEPRRLWVAAEGYVRPIEVTVGPSDGSISEVSGDAIKEGMQVVIGEGRQNDAMSDTTNPFVPQIRRGGQKSKK